MPLVGWRMRFGIDSALCNCCQSFLAPQSINVPEMSALCAVQGPKPDRMPRHMLNWFYTPNPTMLKTRDIAACFWGGAKIHSSKFHVAAPVASGGCGAMAAGRGAVVLSIAGGCDLMHTESAEGVVNVSVSGCGGGGGGGCSGCCGCSDCSACGCG